MCFPVILKSYMSLIFFHHQDQHNRILSQFEQSNELSIFIVGVTIFYVSFNESHSYYNSYNHCDHRTSSNVNVWQKIWFLFKSHHPVSLTLKATEVFTVGVVNWPQLCPVNKSTCKCRLFGSLWRKWGRGRSVHTSFGEVNVPVSGCWRCWTFAEKEFP